MSDDSPATGWQRTTGLLADAVRLAALASIAAAYLWYGWAEVARFTLVLAGLLVPRLARVPRPFDLAYCATLLLAAWSGVAGWYSAITWWDVMVHTVTTGAVAALAYLVLARMDLVHDLHDVRRLSHHHVSIVLLTVALGFGAGVLWEFWEWIGNRYLMASIHVGYTDTVADLAADGAGSLLAGLLLVTWAAAGWGTHRRDEQHPAGRDGEQDQRGPQRSGP